VTFTDPRYTIGKLVALADLNLSLPATVTRAIAAVTAAEQIRVPAPPPPAVLIRQATAEAADRLAQEAAAADQPSFDLGDVSAITGARLAAQEAADRLALSTEVRDAAAALLAQVVAEHAADLIAGIQRRYAEVIKTLRASAKRLPPGADGEYGLQQGGQARESWLRSVDAVAELGQLRDALRFVDAGVPPDPVDGIAICSAWEKSGALARTWMAPAGVTTHGPLGGGVPWWLSVAREPGYELWAPTAAQQSARIAELRAGLHIQRLQAAL
jgi:hypothetical protein